SGAMERYQHRKPGAFADGAVDFDAAFVVFDDAASERQAEASAVSFGGKEGTEDVGQVLRRDAASGVGHDDFGLVAAGNDVDADGAGTLERLNCVQQQVEKPLVDLIAVVVDVGEIVRLVQLNVDGLGDDLLAGEHDSVFDGCVEVSGTDLGTPGACRFEQI